MAFRHISVFRVKDEFRNPETIAMLEARLKEIPEQVPTIIASEIGVKPGQMPTVSPDGHVQFYDLVQIITFASPEDAAGYPASQGHQAFLADSSKYMDNVIGIDYPVMD